MTTEANAGERRGPYWCRACGLPVTLLGSNPDPLFRMAVHSATGQEMGPDTHLAAPIDQKPGSGMPDTAAAVAALGEVTPAMLRETFPQWRFAWLPDGSAAAVRGGPVVPDGPESLLLRTVSAADPTALAERLCLQEWLDGLDAASLAAVWRDMLVQGTPP
jgi:hypothetical protein